MARAARIALDVALGAAKNMKSFGATSWRYLKVEAIPPFTYNFFNGLPGQKLENFADRVSNNFISAIQTKIKEIDDEKERQRLAKLAAIKALEEKLKAEAKKKEEELKKAEAQKAAAEAKAAKAAAEAKKAKAAAEQKKTEPKKDTKTKETSKVRKQKPKGKPIKKKKPK